MFLNQLASSAVNLLSVIYGHVFFPTYSNSLKEVARYLGFRWSGSAASGLTALLWRSQWESSREISLKERLVTYNAEDCEAAAKVADALSAVCQPASSQEKPRADLVNVDSLKREYPQRFGEVQFALREFQQINEAAYWDYQRNKVYVRSNRRLQRLNRETAKGRSGVNIRPNKIIYVDETRPGSCSYCNDPLIYRWGWCRQTVYDLRFSRTGVSRWVVPVLLPPIHLLALQGDLPPVHAKVQVRHRSSRVPALSDHRSADSAERCGQKRLATLRPFSVARLD